MPDTRRRVFFVSDRTGITAETLGNSLLTQFDGVDFQSLTFPFVNTDDKANSVVAYIDHAAREDGVRPIVFSTTVTDSVRQQLKQANALFMDLFDTFIPTVEEELQLSWAHASGRAHGPSTKRYASRIDAMNFALEHDDGQSLRKLDKADVVLIAPSRCGKTPTSLYLALQHGVFAANYPLTEEDLETGQLPKPLKDQQHKLYGLITDATRLSQIREERRPGSKYASIQQTSYELRQATKLYKKFSVPYSDSTNMSVEEIATMVMQEKNLRRHSF